MLDPHTAAELSIEDIRRMCDELIEAHGSIWQCTVKNAKKALLPRLTVVIRLHSRAERLL